MSAKSVSKKVSEPEIPVREKKAHRNGVSDDGRLIEKLQKIVRILEESSLAELKYEDADLIVSLSRHVSAPISMAPMSMAGLPSIGPQTTAPSPPAAPAAPTIATAPASAPESKTMKSEEAGMAVVRSPFIGTFYRSPTPEAEPFVEAGQPVRRGQTLCIVEAMKLMNEIESEVDGVVVEIFVENGRTVQYGDALFKIRTKG